MSDDFTTRIKSIYETKRIQTKKEINDALIDFSKKIEKRKEELYKEVL